MNKYINYIKEAKEKKIVYRDLTAAIVSLSFEKESPYVMPRDCQASRWF